MSTSVLHQKILSLSTKQSILKKYILFYFTLKILTTLFGPILLITSRAMIRSKSFADSAPASPVGWAGSAGRSDASPVAGSEGPAGSISPEKTVV